MNEQESKFKQRMDESKKQMREVENKLVENNERFDEFNERLLMAEKLLKFTQIHECKHDWLSFEIKTD